MRIILINKRWLIKWLCAGKATSVGVKNFKAYGTITVAKILAKMKFLKLNAPLSSFLLGKNFKLQINKINRLKKSRPAHSPMLLVTIL